MDRTGSVREATHLTQNMGDGTFSHSGSLAVRAAVAAGANITFKLLYNGAVAMTGGQPVDGAMSVPALTRWMEAEGVRRVIVTTDEPERYRGVSLAPIAEVRDRSALPSAQERASRDARSDGADSRSGLRRRASAAAQTRTRARAGDARGHQRARVRRLWRLRSEVALPVGGDRSGPSSGQKPRSTKGSCNTDYSCLEGECPSFRQRDPRPRRSARTHAPDRLRRAEPWPSRLSTEPWTIRMIGIGGTGVVTVAQILGMAAMLDGHQTLGLDQTGLAQKGGPVVSDVRHRAGAADAADRGNRPAERYGRRLPRLRPAGCRADRQPAHGPRRRDGRRSSRPARSRPRRWSGTARRPGSARSTARSRRSSATRTRSGTSISTRRPSPSRLFGDHMPANMIVLGAAWQQGLIPISLPAIRGGGHGSTAWRWSRTLRRSAGAARPSPIRTRSPRTRHVARPRRASPRTVRRPRIVGSTPAPIPARSSSAW